MAWLLTAGVAMAQSSSSATMAVSLVVTPNCTLAAGPLAFGTVGAAEAPSQAATASIDIACGPDVAFTVALDDGQNGADGTRRVFDPVTGQTIAYDIYADPAHTRRWGSLGTQSVAGITAPTGAQRLTAYGLIGSETHATAGNYGDLVTVTMNF